MYTGILLLLKILLFINITTVKYNKLLVFLVSGLFIMTIVSLIYLSEGKRKNAIGLTVYSIISLVLFIDVLHYTYFNALPSVQMLSQATQVATVGESLMSIFTWKNLLMVVDIPFVIFISKKFKKKENYGSFLVQNYSKKKRKKFLRFGLPLGFFLALVGTLVFSVKTDVYGSVSRQEVFLYHYTDIKNSLKGEAEEIEIDTREQEALIKDLRERASLKNGKHTGIGKGKNLIVLQIEALQSFVIDMEYKGVEVTPNLNKLIKDSGSIYFDSYYQLIGKGNTSDAEFSTNNSLYPSMTGPSYTNYQDNTFYGLPWNLRDEGYTAWSFHGFKRAFWNREKAYPQQGFERYISEEDLDVKEEDVIGFGVNDEKFFKDSMPYLKELAETDENPFYAFMISLTSHNPFKMPEHLNVIDLDDKHVDTIFGNYLQSIHYTDKQLGMFIEELKKEGLYDDTVIALYGDHFAVSAASEKDKDIMTDYFKEEYTLDQMMNIPLIIHVPGEEINERVSKVGSQMDFYPTMMNIMGLENKKGIVFGRDILNYQGENIIAPQTYMIKGSFITDDVVFVMSRDGVFENSTAYNRKTREKLDPKDYRKEYDTLIKEINTGDYIMKKNLMGEILDGKNQLGGGENSNHLSLSPTVKNTDGTLDSLNLSVEKGYKSVKIPMIYREDLDRLEIGKNISLEDFTKWLEDNQDISVVATVEDPKLIGRTFLSLIEEDKDLMVERVYPQVDVFDGYQFLKTQGFEPIANISAMGFGEKELMDFVDRYSVQIVAIDKDKLDENTVKNLKGKSVSSYIYNVDSRIKRKILQRKGISGIFTNKLK